MKKITSLFDPCREKNISEEALDQIFQKQHATSSSHSADTQKSMVKSIISDICCGKCSLSSQQEDEIAKSLSDNCQGRNVDLKIWKKCFRYWTRKNTNDKTALLIIDVQNDFISGSLALRNCPAKHEGEEVVAVINKLKQDHKFGMVVFSLDWHPKDHCSFITNVGKYPIHSTSCVKAETAKVFDSVVYDCGHSHGQILWPAHCEQGSDGAKLHSCLKVDAADTQIYKGTSPLIDSYSAFWDNGKLSQTDLLGVLLDHDITRVFICGLATDICVAYTAVDAAEHGFETYMIDDASRGVSLDSIESEKKRMTAAGVKIINSSQVGKLI